MAGRSIEYERNTKKAGKVEAQVTRRTGENPGKRKLGQFTHGLAAIPRNLS